MILASLILVLSTALFCFYFQATCQRILRREFERDYFRSIVDANNLEFASMQERAKEFGMPMQYQHTRSAFRCDFEVLRYLIKGAGSPKRRATREEHLLMLYFRAILLSLAIRHWLRLRQEPAMLKLSAVLQYFANLVGQRVEVVRFANLYALGQCS